MLKRGEAAGLQNYLGSTAGSRAVASLSVFTFGSSANLLDNIGPASL